MKCYLPSWHLTKKSAKCDFVVWCWRWRQRWEWWWPDFGSGSQIIIRFYRLKSHWSILGIEYHIRQDCGYTPFTTSSNYLHPLTWGRRKKQPDLNANHSSTQQIFFFLFKIFYEIVLKTFLLSHHKFSLCARKHTQCRTQTLHYICVDIFKSSLVVEFWWIFSS